MAGNHKCLCTLCLERKFAGWEGGKAQRAPAQAANLGSLNCQFKVVAANVERGRAALCPLPYLQVSGA